MLPQSLWRAIEFPLSRRSDDLIPKVNGRFYKYSGLKTPAKMDSCKSFIKAASYTIIASFEFNVFLGYGVADMAW